MRFQIKNSWIKKVLTIIILIILCSVYIYPIANCYELDEYPQTTFGRTILFVGGVGPGNYTKIQDAIDNASDGDIIFVYNGVYYENITVDKSIKLTGEKLKNTIIDGCYSYYVIQILSEKVFVKNLTIRNSGGYNKNAGIIIGSENNSIINCQIYRTKSGIFIEEVNNNIIENCSFHSNGEGIQFKTSNNNIVKNCSFSHNSIGFHTENSTNCNLYYTNFCNNGMSCLFNDSLNIQIEKCNISDNSVNLGGVFFIKCYDVIVNNSIFCHNGVGITLSSSELITIKNCDFNLNTHYGISMRSASRNVIISKCEIINNYRYGFYIEPKNNCKITNNNIDENTLYGLFYKLAKCNARYNWWGSPLGPSYTEFRPSSKISIFSRIIRFFPWLTKPIENIGANWDNDIVYNNISNETEIQLPGNDTDEDGAPDWWEEKWGYNANSWDDHINLDPDTDALNNFEECYTDKYGSNPFYKDIFLEIDWMNSSNSFFSNKPPQELLDKVISNFKEQNISLHIDIGNLEGGEEIPACNTVFSYDKLRDIYWSFFLKNDIRNPRKGIFHYGVICNYCPDSNFPFFGWDQFDSFAISAQWLKEIHPLFSTGRLIVGATVHHLGHTLGLKADMHDGIDNIETLRPFTIQWWKYRNYKSCMNYWYKYKIFSYSDGKHGLGDFNDWGNLNFSFFKNSDFAQ
jgi:parallel beta-helix repeat protein